MTPVKRVMKNIGIEKKMRGTNQVKKQVIGPNWKGKGIKKSHRQNAKKKGFSNQGRGG